MTEHISQTSKTYEVTTDGSRAQYAALGALANTFGWDVKERSELPQWKIYNQDQLTADLFTAVSQELWDSPAYGIQAHESIKVLHDSVVRHGSVYKHGHDFTFAPAYVYAGDYHEFDWYLGMKRLVGTDADPQTKLDHNIVDAVDECPLPFGLEVTKCNVDPFSTKSYDIQPLHMSFDTLARYVQHNSLAGHNFQGATGKAFDVLLALIGDSPTEREETLTGVDYISVNRFGRVLLANDITNGQLLTLKRKLNDAYMAQMVRARKADDIGELIVEGACGVPHPFGQHKLNMEYIALASIERFSVRTRSQNKNVSRAFEHIRELNERYEDVT